MNHIDDTSGEIFISPHNKMTVKYRLYAVSDEDILTEIDVMYGECSDVVTEIDVRVEEDNSKEAEINVVYGDYSDIGAEIQPIIHNEISTEIDIRPGNRMWALYNIQEPPKLEEIFNPVQDSFTRSNTQYESINYGSNSSLAVGRTVDDSYDSFIKFDFDDWNPSYVITDTKLRLHYSGTIPSGTELELFTVDESWSEYGITYLNQPKPESFIVSDYTNNESARYIEFDFKDITVNWVKNNVANNGFVIRLSNENPDTILMFRARESNRPPELTITYYDNRIYSSGRSQASAELFVWQIGDSDTRAEVTVGSVVENRDTLTEIYVHRYEDPVDFDVESEITVSKPNVWSEVIVSIDDEYDVEAELVVRSDTLDSRKEAEITVSKPDVWSEIFVSSIDSIDTEINVRRNEESDKLVEISVTRKEILTEITPRPYEHSDVNTEINVKAVFESETLTEISVTRPDIHTEINVRAVEESDMETEVFVRVEEESETLTEIIVSKPDIYTEITVVEFNDVETEIYVKHTSDVETEIVASIPQTLAEIYVPYWDDNDVLTEIQPRILRVNDTVTEITVRGSSARGYVYIV